MTWYRVCLACAVSAALVSCKYEQGVMQPLAPLAGLRYVNVVNDTGAVDFRIINFIGDAPNAGAATFRTGGAPYGVSTSFLPPHFPVEAGRDVQIRVFMNGTEPSVASTVVFDTTCTFTAGVNYTFYLYGSARTTGGVHSLVTVDTVAAPATGKIKLRVLNLARSLAGLDSLFSPTAVDTTTLTDAWVRSTFTAVPFTGTAHSTYAFGVPSAWQEYDRDSTYRLALTARGTTSPILLQAGLPRGVAGTSSSNAVAGAVVAGTAITALIVPRSVAPSGAPQTGAPSSRSALTSGGVSGVTRSNDTVTIQTGHVRQLVRRSVGGLPLPGDSLWRGDTLIVTRVKADSTLLNSGNSLNVTRGDNIFVSGATQPEYNGWLSVMGTADTTFCVMQDSLVDTRRDAGACPTLIPTLRTRADSLAAPKNVVIVTRYRFRTKIVTTPVSPATGSPVYRVYPLQATPNYRIPWILFQIDRKPDLTAP